MVKTIKNIVQNISTTKFKHNRNLIANGNTKKKKIIYWEV